MESTRQSKISRLIQKELSEIFLLQAKSMNGVLVSVTSTRISPDLSIARVYVSVFPSDRSDEIVKNLNANMRSIRFCVLFFRFFEHLGCIFACDNPMMLCHICHSYNCI